MNREEESLCKLYFSEVPETTRNISAALVQHKTPASFCRSIFSESFTEDQGHTGDAFLDTLIDTAKMNDATPRCTIREHIKQIVGSRCTSGLGLSEDGTYVVHMWRAGNASDELVTHMIAHQLSRMVLLLAGDPSACGTELIVWVARQSARWTKHVQNRTCKKSLIKKKHRKGKR